ncbi:FAD-dependent oxidoreductase [Oxyplasma meridianum]|uniref:FAD-dependent oxidoreductase n=1 Tax=Oxyplasma meridianum TaxID=3073602 RepID=A0AAX4NIU9_9ARCH
MSEFDVIVVGAGPAGSSAAIRLASKKMNVLLVEKSDPPGTKNVSGGVLWGHELDNIIPDWEKTAPVERYVKSKTVGFLTEDSSINIDFRSRKFDENKSGYTVLRVKLDQWLAKKASESGAMLVNGVTVDKLAMKDGKVIGVEQDGDTITADTVILAEGANPRVAIQSGIREPLKDRDVAIGVKEVIKLPEDKINERFNLRGKEGFAGEYVFGFLKGGVEAGGFLYTNKDSISLGAVVSMEHLRSNGNTHSFDIIEQFNSHPSIAPLIEGGKIDEYSAHMVQEGGFGSIPKLFGDGYMIAGDAAGFSFSNGLVLQGMNYAIQSGITAADTFMELKEKGNYSDSALSLYQEKLQKTFVLQDMINFKGIENVTWGNLIHQHLPNILESVMLEIFMENGMPKRHMYKILMDAMKKENVSSSKMISESFKMIRRL